MVGSDVGQDDCFACSIAVFGSTVVVGAPGHANIAGWVYVFER